MRIALEVKRIPKKREKLAGGKRTSSPPIIRLAHPLAFAAFLRHIGSPVERHLRRSKLPVLNNNPNGFVPLDSAWSFFGAGARFEDNMLGWHVGRFVGDNNLNQKLLRQLENAPTLYQALHRMVTMVSSEASHLQLGIIERSEDILFYTRYSGRREDTGYMASQAYQLEAYLNLIRHFLGKRWVPPEIGIEYPNSSPVVEHHFPGARILSGQEMGYLTIPRSCLHVSARGKGGDVLKADDLLFTEKLAYVDTLRLLLRSYMADGYISEEFAASLMDTSVRTLSRRLSEHGLTYGTLIDEVRFKTAKEKLQTSEMNIIDVARSVGFEDHSDFSRMFRRVGGLSPREFRRFCQSG